MVLSYHFYSNFCHSLVKDIRDIRKLDVAVWRFINLPADILFKIYFLLTAWIFHFSHCTWVSLQNWLAFLENDLHLQARVIKRTESVVKVEQADSPALKYSSAQVPASQTKKFELGILLDTSTPITSSKKYHVSYKRFHNTVYCALLSDNKKSAIF